MHWLFATTHWVASNLRDDHGYTQTHKGNVEYWKHHNSAQEWAKRKTEENGEVYQDPRKPQSQGWLLAFILKKTKPSTTLSTTNLASTPSISLSTYTYENISSFSNNSNVAKSSVDNSSVQYQSHGRSPASCEGDILYQRSWVNCAVYLTNMQRSLLQLGMWQKSFVKQWITISTQPNANALAQIIHNTHARVVGVIATNLYGQRKVSF